jgi:hypothetical protein
MDQEREKGCAHHEADEFILYFRGMGLTVTGDPGKRGLGTWQLKHVVRFWRAETRSAGDKDDKGKLNERFGWASIPMTTDAEGQITVAKDVWDTAALGGTSSQSGGTNDSREYKRISLEKEVEGDWTLGLSRETRRRMAEGTIENWMLDEKEIWEPIGRREGSITKSDGGRERTIGGVEAWKGGFVSALNGGRLEIIAGTEGGKGGFRIGTNGGRLGTIARNEDERSGVRVETDGGVAEMEGGRQGLARELNGGRLGINARIEMGAEESRIESDGGKLETIAGNEDVRREVRVETNGGVAEMEGGRQGFARESNGGSLGINAGIDAESEESRIESDGGVLARTKGEREREMGYTQQMDPGEKPRLSLEDGG